MGQRSKSGCSRFCLRRRGWISWEGDIEDERRARRGSRMIGSEAVSAAIPGRFGVFPTPNRS
ncbi:MAG: hypothetical protein LC781_07085, partial [Actinobacteria bacterium]|nr:hypothetical protein [Actinomycetota bacterium]